MKHINWKKAVLNDVRRRRRKRDNRKSKPIFSAAHIVRALGGKETGPGQYMACCPAHKDKSPSLAIKENHYKVLFYCFAGCSYKDIVNALKHRNIINDGTKLWNQSAGLPDGISEIFKAKKYVAHWTYKNDQEEAVGHVVRYESENGQKEIIPYFKFEGSQWKPGYDKSSNRILYNLHKIYKSDIEKEIWIVEGEKCADALTKLRCLATTSPGGAMAMNKTDWSPLERRRIIIWPDNDQAGKAYAANVFHHLMNEGGSGIDIRMVDIDTLGLNEKEDVYDWVQKGNSESDILKLPLKDVIDFSDLGVIEYNPAENHVAVDKAEELLLKIKPYEIYQYCNRLVRILHTTSKKITGNEESVELTEINAGYYLDLLNRNITFVKMTQNGLTAIDPPAKIATRYISRIGFWKVHRLSGLIYAPTIIKGHILQRSGYDRDTGIYYADLGLNFRALPDYLDRDRALKALDRLRYILQDFPFVNDEDESVMLAAILTSLVRKSIPTAPMFGFTALIAGSGKTLLANVISIIATGRQAIVATHGADKEEERKALFSKLLQGRPILLIDNIERPLQSETLNAILTAPGSTYSDRILGRSEIVEVPTNVTILATGNNLIIQGDLTRRVLLCTIDPKKENPETRRNFKVKGRLENHVLKRRAHYVRESLVIIKAYIDAGYPRQKISQFGSFEEWSDLIRSALVWLDCADPNLTRKRIEADDPVKMNRKNIINLWKDIYDKDEVKVSEIVADCNQMIENKNIDAPEYELGQAFLEVSRGRGRMLESRAIGNWLSHNKDIIVDGSKIVKSPFSTKGAAVSWKLEKI